MTTHTEVCTVELVGDIDVDGASATFMFRDVGSAIAGYTCKLDGTVLPNCMPLNIAIAQTTTVSICTYPSRTGSNPLTGLRPRVHTA